MGGTKSKGQVMSQHTPNAPSEPPYPGPPAQYHFVNTEIMMSRVINFSFMASQMMTSDIDAYYPALAQPYAQGFRLLSFYHIPGQVKRAGGLFNPSVLQPFQGIFCRYPSQPSNQTYQLKIEKSVIQPQVVWNGFISMRSDVHTDIQHLFQTIANNTQNGGRLVCIELTGQERLDPSFSFTRVPRMPAKGCDLFFEIPTGVEPVERYNYNVVSAPIVVTYKGFNPVPQVQCDWAGILASQLNQGWKLVEIFMDETESVQQHGFSGVKQLNAQWFFEKPFSCMNDPRPVWQGTVVEHIIHIKSGFSGTKTTANWEGLIGELGNKGWELACILETPEVVMSGFGQVEMKVLLFLQRPLIIPGGPPPPQGEPHLHGGPPPPGAQNGPPPPGFNPDAQGVPPPPYPYKEG